MLANNATNFTKGDKTMRRSALHTHATASERMELLSDKTKMHPRPHILRHLQRFKIERNSVNKQKESINQTQKQAHRRYHE